ncbi:MAG: hypothetical protein ABJE95_07530 [Byssovorax sp.]
MLRSLRSLGSATLLTLAITAGSSCSSDSITPAPKPIECPADTVKTGLPLLGADCDPLTPDQCGYPFPSNVYLADDPSTVTGKHVAFGEKTLPIYTGGARVDRTVWDDSDGFSPGQPALFYFPGATVKGLPTQDTIESSLGADSPTVLIDAETGERVPHFTERDESLVGEQPEERAMIIRPVVRLKDHTRYLVAVRKVVDADGKTMEPSPVFKALRDGADSCDVSVTRRRDLYKDIFARLTKAGIKTADLQLAWDYTTASRENNTSRFLHMRDEALTTVGPKGPEYTITLVEDNPNPHIFKRITALMKVPLYVDKDGPGAKFTLDDKGMPKQNGFAEYEVLIHVPNSALKGTPAALLQNGHGLLGSKHEGQDGYLAEIADKWNYVAFSVDFIGMAHDDVTVVTDSIVSDIRGFKGAVERQHQGLLNSLLAMRMMMGRFVDEPLLQNNGKSMIDPTKRYYRGDSQGGIFGTSYMSVSTDVTRGLLGEPGAPYSLLLNRSVDFGFYFTLLKGAYQSGRNIQLMLGLVQMIWDRTEPDGYMPYINENMLPGTPQHQVLIDVGIGDFQVTPLGAHIIARTVKAKNLKPVNRTIWGIPDTDGPFMGSGLVEYSFGLPDAPKENIPNAGPDGADPHDKVRSLASAIDQEDEFFRTGTIKAFCQGSCDPE